MAWTYEIGQLTTNRLFQLRWLVGDILVKDPQMQDEELSFALSQRSSIYGAACDVCLALAARLSREADSSQGPLRTAYSTRSRAYAQRAAQYEVMAFVRSGGLPYSGGVSLNDYQSMASDPDRIGPQFQIGLDDTDTPVGPARTQVG